MTENTKTIERVLTKRAQGTAKKYEVLYGTLKNALSAAILAFDKLSADEQRDALVSATLPKEHHGKKPQPDENISDCIETVKHFIRYKIPSEDEKRQLKSLRRALGPDPQIERARANSKRHKKL